MLRRTNRPFRDDPIVRCDASGNEVIEPAAGREVYEEWLTLFVVGVALTLQACSRTSVTGGYIFTDPTTMEYITLVEDAGGRVDGQLIFASTTWQDVSGFAQVEGHLSGTVNRKVLNLTLTSPRWPAPTQMSGSLDGRYLVLTTRGAFPMRYSAITPERYASLRKALIAGQKLESTDR